MISLGAVGDFIAREFGGICRMLPPRLVAINAVSATTLCLHDPERVWLLFSASNFIDTAFLSPEGNVLGIQGIPLSGSEGILQFDVRFDAVMPTLGYSAISEAGAMTILVVELKRDTRTPQKEG